MLKQNTEKKLRFRKATLEDAKLLFDWRNDEDTRRMSSSISALSWDEHIAWLTSTLSGGFPGREFYVVEDEGGEPIGTVRSDERSDGYTEVSYTIAPALRGKGLGKRMLVQFAREKLAGKRLAARIKKGVNPASEALARALGLSEFSETPPENSEEPPMVEWR